MLVALDVPALPPRSSGGFPDTICIAFPPTMVYPSGINGGGNDGGTYAAGPGALAKGLDENFLAGNRKLGYGFVIILLWNYHLI